MLVAQLGEWCVDVCMLKYKQQVVERRAAHGAYHQSLSGFLAVHNAGHHVLSWFYTANYVPVSTGVVEHTPYSSLSVQDSLPTDTLTRIDHTGYCL